ncbi:hypothetical protein Hypma_006524 [Hypsizygus marmoreus]|uniref:Uncharacterized protein n=1 Tax=Hypsizygus marmoreus TaxID=39966 RepID=A0A369K3T1_HYPMA|nr:hypothetical protein Hypma_006524 [Hypsizygus marmoreus]
MWISSAFPPADLTENSWTANTTIPPVIGTATEGHLQLSLFDLLLMAKLWSLAVSICQGSTEIHPSAVLEPRSRQMKRSRTFGPSNLHQTWFRHVWMDSKLLTIAGYTNSSRGSNLQFHPLRCLHA